MTALGLGSGAGEDCEPEERKENRHFARSGARRRRRRTAVGDAIGGAGAVTPDSLIHCSSDNHSVSSAGVAGAGSALFISSATTNLAGDRCSFGFGHDVLVLPLAGRESSGCAPGPEPDFAAQETSSSPFASHNQRHCNPPPNPSKGLEEDSTQREADQQAVVEKEETTLDPANSFSKAFAALASEECLNQKSKCEDPCLPCRKPRRPRPASVDFIGQGTDVSILSPRFLVGGGVARMKKGSAASSHSRSGTFPSPGTPSYRRGSGAAAYQKGWSSERVPLPKNGNRRYAASSVFLPFNNGRTLPSKWEDAEKWILSPVSGDGFGRSSVPPPHHRRPKSKSGPLGTQVIAGAYSSVSPLVPCFDNGRVANFTANSPFLAGVLLPERGCCVNPNGRERGLTTRRGVEVNGSGEGRLYPMNEEHYIARSASIHGWSDTVVESSCSLPSSRDEKSEDAREVASVISPPVVMNDAATQMSPRGSTPSSPKDISSFSCPPQSTHPIGQLEVRNVQVDDQVTVTRWSKKHIARSSDCPSANIIEWMKKSVESETSWEVAESKSISKYKREEAKITAWENLHKAKAEAEIRKLEMKLEKKRSSSMDKILSKLRSAQKKAQDMRSVVDGKQRNQILRTPRKASYFSNTGHVSSLSGCFTCHAF